MASSSYTDAQIIELSATTLAQLIRTRVLTSVQVTQAFICRIDEVNPTLNAVVERNEKALEDAKVLDQYLQETGKVKGPLHGVPITIKEQYGVKGFRQTQGGLHCFKDHVATEDSPVVARIRAAGVVILGTTNTPEMAMAYETTNNLYGRTNNAVNPDRSAGGSSGGEGAIVAAKGSPFGLGTDIGGSIRIPCHFNGLSGLKPTKGRVPVTAGYYLGDQIKFEQLVVSAEMGTFGPMSRFVEDLELGLSLISGPDYVDSWCFLPAYEAGSSSKVNVSELRIAYIEEHDSAPVTSCTKEAIEKAVQLLKQSGAVVTKAVPSVVGSSLGLWAKVAGRLGGEGYRTMAVAGGGKMTEQLDWMAAFLEPNKISTAMEYEQLLMAWRAFNNELWSFMRDYDAILAPITPSPAIPHNTANNFKDLTYTALFSLSGYPCVAVGNVGTGKGDFEGLPIGLQVATAPYREDVGLAIAKYLELQLKKSTSSVA